MTTYLQQNIDTPCGPVPIKIPVPGLNLPSFPPDLPFPFFLTFTIPMPDCSLLKHIGSAEEPASDSVP